MLGGDDSYGQDSGRSDVAFHFRPGCSMISGIRPCRANQVSLDINWQCWRLINITPTSAASMTQEAYENRRLSFHLSIH
jgi:hypothetical protein